MILHYFLSFYFWSAGIHQTMMMMMMCVFDVYFSQWKFARARDHSFDCLAKKFGSIADKSTNSHQITTLYCNCCIEKWLSDGSNREKEGAKERERKRAQKIPLHLVSIVNLEARFHVNFQLHLKHQLTHAHSCDGAYVFFCCRCCCLDATPCGLLN